MPVLTDLRRLEPVGSRIWFDLTRQDEPIEPHIQGKIPEGATIYAVIESNQVIERGPRGSWYRTAVQFYK